MALLGYSISMEHLLAIFSTFSHGQETRWSELCPYIHHFVWSDCLYISSSNLIFINSGIKLKVCLITEVE